MKFLISVTFPRKKLKYLCVGQLFLVSEVNICNQSFSTITSLSQKLQKLKKKFLMDARCKTWAVFSDNTRIFWSLLRVLIWNQFLMERYVSALNIQRIISCPLVDSGQIPKQLRGNAQLYFLTAHFIRPNFLHFLHQVKIFFTSK